MCIKKPYQRIIFKVFSLPSLVYRNIRDEGEGKGVSQNGTSQQTALILSTWLAQVANRKCFWQSGYKSYTSMALTLCQWAFIALNRLPEENTQIPDFKDHKRSNLSNKSWRKKWFSTQLLVINSSGNVAGDEVWGNPLVAHGREPSLNEKRRTCLIAPSHVTRET